MRRSSLVLGSLAVASLIHLVAISMWEPSPATAARERRREARTVMLARPGQMTAVGSMPADLTTPPKVAAEPAADLFLEIPSQFERGTDGEACVLATRVTGPGQFAAAPGTQVEVSLMNGNQAIASAAGRTGDDGRFIARFAVPSDAPGYVTLVAKLPGEAFQASGNCAVLARREPTRMLLVSDKPVYQPGQVIHLRTLALDSRTLKPASGEVVFEVEDSKGNKVFKKRCVLSPQGVASADFQLADEVLMGDYRISALAGDVRGEKSVVVKKYVLPKYKVAVSTDRSWYLPKDTVRGTIRSDYFFGKAVAGAEVTVKAITFDAAFREFAKVVAETDGEGVATFEIVLPDYFVGQPLDSGKAYLKLDVTVKDSAGHEEQATVSLNVANRAISLAAVPESGKLVAGVENTIFVVATAPDGAPVECDVELELPGTTVRGRTDETGVAELVCTPAAPGNVPAGLRARDAQGNECVVKTILMSDPGRDRILLRLDRATAKAGQAIGIEALGTFGTGRVFVDAIRAGRAVMTASIDMKDGRARTEIAIPPGEFGAMEIHAYTLLATGEVVRDTRLIHVEPANDLRIEMKADRESWRPGEKATIEFHVTGEDGKDAAAALGVVVVDESVYAVQDLQPGMEKVFFTLAKELQEPRYGIKWRGGIASVVGGDDGEARTRRVARALLAAVEPQGTITTATTATARKEAFLRKQALVWRMLEQWILTWREKWHEVDPATGAGKWVPHLLRIMVADGRLKVGDTLLTDPWGNEITLEALAKVHPSFTLEFWTRALSRVRMPELRKALVQLGAQGDLVADGKFVPDLNDRLIAAGLKDGLLTLTFGHPMRAEDLPALDPAFSIESLVYSATQLQQVQIWPALVEHVAHYGGIRKTENGWVYEATVARDAILPARFPDGSPMSLNRLLTECSAFEPSNVLKAAWSARNAELKRSIASFVAVAGWREAVSDDLVSWRPGIEDRLVREGTLSPSKLQAASGAPYTLAEAALLDPSISVGTLVPGRFSASIASITLAVCREWHGSGCPPLPGDAVGSLLKEGRITEDQAKDPWGIPIRIFPLQAGESAAVFGCALLDGKRKFMSAGPDREFGTADDVRVDLPQPAAAPIVFATPAPLVKGSEYAGPRQDLAPPEFQRYIWMLRRAGAKADMEAIYFPDAEDSDHNESDNFGAMKGDSLEFLSAMPGEGGGIRGRAPGVYDAMGVGGGGGGGGTYGTAMGGGRRNVRAGSAGPAEPPSGIRVREWFPETLVWNPLLITDERGRARLDIPLADSITTWRMTASASSADGRLGSATRGLLVFQPFFADIDFPVALTQNDEVSVPVAVYNYLKVPQDVNLKVEKEDWFELQGSPRATISLQSGEVRAAHFRVKVKGLGRRRLTVYAWGADEAARDAIRREVEIVPDGQMVEVVLNSRLDAPISTTIPLPASSIPGTTKIFAKIYPGVLSQVVEGVEGLLGMPHG